LEVGRHPWTAVLRPLENVVAETEAGGSAVDRDAESGEGCICDFVDAFCRAGQITSQGTETVAQAEPVGVETAHDLLDVARPRQTAAEAQRAQAPAAAEPEVGLLAPILECGRSEQGTRRLGGQQALKDDAGVTVVADAIDSPGDDFVRNAGRVFDTGE